MEYHRHLGYIIKLRNKTLLQKGGRGMDAHMQGPSKYEGTDRRRTVTVKPWHHARVVACASHAFSSGLAQACLVWFGLFCLVSPAPWNHVQGNCEDSAALRDGLETGTANSWETTNSKPPGPVIMIDQLERGSTNQIIFIYTVFCRRKALLRLLLASPTCVHYARPKLFSWAKLVNWTFLHPMLLCWITYSAPLGILVEHFHLRPVCGPALEIFY
jgi:hypothetical protein